MMVWCGAGHPVGLLLLSPLDLESAAWLTTASFLDGDGFFGSTMTTASHLGDEGLGSEPASASFSTSGQAQIWIGYFLFLKINFSCQSATISQRVYFSDKIYYQSFFK
jgi:hypothetical protein